MAVCQLIEDSSNSGGQIANCDELLSWQKMKLLRRLKSGMGQAELDGL